MPLCQAENAKAVSENTEEGHGGPGTELHALPLQVQELRENKEQQKRDAEQDGMGRDGERRMALQQRHREYRVGARANGGDEDKQVPERLACPTSARPARPGRHQQYEIRRR